MYESSDPANARLETETHFSTGGWTSQINVRAHSAHYGYYWDVTFQIRVCGEESITMLEYNPKVYKSLMLWVDPSNSTVLASDKYVSIPQATFERWFRLEPANDPCYIKDYTLHSAWVYEPISKFLAHAPFDTTQ